MWFAIMFLLLCAQARAEGDSVVANQRRDHYEKISEPFFKQFMGSGDQKYGQPVEALEGEHPYLALLLDDNIQGSFRDRAIASCVLTSPTSFACHAGLWPNYCKYRILFDHYVAEDSTPLEHLNPWIFDDWKEQETKNLSLQNVMFFKLTTPVKFNRQRSLLTCHQRYPGNAFLDDNDYENWDPSWFLLKQATWIFNGTGFVRAEIPITLTAEQGSAESVVSESARYTYVTEQVSRNDNLDQFFPTHRPDYGAPLLAGYGATAFRTESKNETKRYGLALSYRDNLYSLTGVPGMYHAFFPIPEDSYNLVDEEAKRLSRVERLTGPLLQDFVHTEEESYRYDEIKKRDCDYSAT